MLIANAAPLVAKLNSATQNINTAVFYSLVEHADISAVKKRRLLRRWNHSYRFRGFVQDEWSDMVEDADDDGVEIDWIALLKALLEVLLSFL